MAIFDLPLSARPGKDTPVGQDELGRTVYRTVTGQEYTMPEAPRISPGPSRPMQGPPAYAAPERMAEMGDYAASLGGMQGGYSADDLSAAGFTPMEVTAFTNASRASTAAPIDTAREEELYGTLQEPDYTMRESATARVQNALIEQVGMDPYQAGVYARRIMGDPNAAGILESVGLIDVASMVGGGASLAAKGVGLAGRTLAAAPAALSGLFNVEEGSQATARGYDAGSVLQTGLGALQAAVGVAEMFPAARLISEGIAQTASRMDPNTLFSVFGPPMPARAPETGSGSGRAPVTFDDVEREMRAMPEQPAAPAVPPMEPARPAAPPARSLADFVADESGALRIPAGGQSLPAPRNEAEAMARDILQLRAEGRADEVTEEMMAAADPQYMYFNTPLPMDYESRMARAIQQGFDVNDEMYRGDAPRQAFETGRGQRDQIGVTASSIPDVAASYIPARGEGGIYPLFSRGENDAVINAGGQNWNVILPDTPVRFQGEQSRLDEYIPVNEYFEPYDVAAGTAFFDTNDLSRIFQGYGADRVRFNELVDRGASARYYGPQSASPSDVTMVANPANVRSRFARFDPEFRNLRNLSAGIGGAAVLTALAEDAEAGAPEMQIMGLVQQSGITGAAEALGVSPRDIEEAIAIAVPPSQWEQLVVGPR